MTKERLKQKTHAILSLGTITRTDLNKLLYAWEALRTDGEPPSELVDKTKELRNRLWDGWLMPRPSALVSFFL